MGLWQFDHELNVGENVIFEDMIHYTTVKTTMFNGIGHPVDGLPACRRRRSKFCANLATKTTKIRMD